MAQVRFTLRKPKADKPQPIYLVYNFGRNDKLVYPTGFKVLPKHWNAEKYRVRNVASAKHKDIINDFLAELQTATERFILERKAKRLPLTKADLKEFLDVYFNKKVDEKHLTLFQFIELFINEAKTKGNPRTGKVVSENTLRVYKSTLKHLREFAKSLGKEDFYFSEVDYSFYTDLVEFLQEEMLSTNTIAKVVKTLKTFLNEAYARGLDNDLARRIKKFRVVTEETTAIYLTPEEIKRIYDLDLSGNKTLDLIRDYFVLASWLGVRFSDWDQIRKENIKDNILHITQTKTGIKTVVPINLSPIVTAILDKYEWNLPPVPANQTVNEALKELGRLAGIDQPISRRITKGGREVIVKVPKYELITTHTARRSFASNNYNLGIPVKTIMKATGHKTEREFYKYIRLTPKDHVKVMVTAWQNAGSNLEVVKTAN